MATYFVASGGSNTAPYDTWAKAATSLATALAAATAAGDVVVIQFDGVPATDNALAADTTYTFAADNVSLISSTNSGTGTITPTEMGTANWIGHSTLNRSISIAAPNRKAYVYGVTLRTAGGTADNIILAVSDGQDATYENCYFWSGNTQANTKIQIGSNDTQVVVRAKNCTFRFAATSQNFRIGGKLVLEGGSISTAGSAPGSSGLFQADQTDPGGASVEAVGFDMSYLGSNAIVGNATTNAFTVRLSQCKLGASYTLLATQTNLNGSSAEIYAFDCASGDTHGLFAYANPLGSVVSDTGIYFTSGAAGQSWKVTTTAEATFNTPFVTPWFGYYNTGTSAITPYIEILRDGSATAYDNDEVWMDVAAKTTSGSTQATLYTDRMAIAGTPAAQDNGAGLGSWTGEGGTAWSGKLQLGSSITPAENGHISARIVVGLASATVYADPQIRT